MKIGIQVYSVRDDASKDFAGTMSLIKKMGYDGVELAGLYGMEPKEVRRICNENGLVCISAHVPYAELCADLEGTVAKYIEIGCRFIAIPYMGEGDRPADPNFEATVKKIGEIGKYCASKGITLLYHNHDFEFVKVGDVFGLDYLYSTVPADYLKTELDTCWVSVAGQSAPGYVRKYAGRCPLVHIKDYSGSKSENMYELIGIEKKAAPVSTFRFEPVGHGVQDVPAIVKASEESGAEWVIVEQDSSLDRAPLVAANMSIDYLKSVK